MQPLGGRVAIVTGGGRGLGRAHGLALAAAGACVVVNDVCCALDGSGTDAYAITGNAIAQLARPRLPALTA